MRFQAKDVDMHMIEKLHLPLNFIPKQASAHTASRFHQAHCTFFAWLTFGWQQARLPHAARRHMSHGLQTLYICQWCPCCTYWAGCSDPAKRSIFKQALYKKLPTNTQGFNICSIAPSNILPAVWGYPGISSTKDHQTPVHSHSGRQQTLPWRASFALTF